MAVPIWPKGGTKLRGIDLYRKDIVNKEIDLRQEMNNLLEGTEFCPRRGHWVILRRADKRQKCSCWNKVASGDNRYRDDKRKYDEAEENCPYCSGDGWIYSDELYLARRRLVAPDIGLTREEEMAPVGIMNVQSIMYYFQYYVNPKKEDRIIEIQLDDDQQPVRPIVHTEVFKVNVAESLRDINGRIEYWRCAVEMEVI
jgi:hypothetical protein